MTQVPAHLEPIMVRRAQHRQEARPVIGTWLVLDQVPAQPIARDVDAMISQRAIIRATEAIMLGRADEIEPPAIEAPLACTLEAAHEPAAEETIRRHSHGMI